MKPGSRLTGRSTLPFLFAFSVITHCDASDWPLYRGPDSNGISRETIRTNWAENAPRRLWKVPLEPALSSFSVSDGRAFTQVRRRVNGQDQEVCAALDAETGQELWAVPLGSADYPNGGVGADDGPRSTPSVQGTRVYVLTSYLRLACLDAANGKVVWNKDLVAEYQAVVVPWQNAASPLIVDGLILVNGNAANRRLLAIRTEDGSLAWRQHDAAMTQSTPVFATIAGVRQVIFFTQSGLVSVTPESGDLLWRYSLPFSTSTAMTPVVSGDLVYASAAYGVGAGTVRIQKTGATLAATEVWRTRGANMNHWATPVPVDNHLYGIYGQSATSLRCVDLATGAEKWRQGGAGYGSVLLISGTILMLTEDGNLVLVQPDSSAYREIVRFKAVSGKCWNIPALSNGRIYVRSTTEAAAYDVAPAQPRNLKLQPAVTSDGAFLVTLLSDDGTAVDPILAPEIDVFAADELTAGPITWTKVSSTLLTNSPGLRLQDPDLRTVPHRFFRVEQRP